MTKLTTLIASALIALSLSATGHAADKLLLGTEGAYAPFNSIDKDGKLVGFDIDIGNALCKAMEVECEWVTSDWDGLIPALDAKKFDAIIASMSITAERKEKIDFTNKYYSTPIKCVREVGKDVDPTDTDKLKGKMVGVQSGVVADNFARAKFKDIAEVTAYKTQEEANLDLLSGRVDLVCADSVVLAPFVKDEKNAGKVEFVGGDFTDVEFVGEGVGIGVRKGDAALIEKLNKAIAKIREDGTYAEINKKYFDFDLYGN
ncbi:MAG: lysine/arginine/ornithine ABC transporter substrate-binding protein [Thiofilum sp.]|uniref:lysine/arginine/ornithine ABC transporter substrate-binding protein n=1 Tax=Thiofilum sp. TaxID=2212733 RepID=UPI0025E971D7|nr:lysine/arginine/ornithine ABC transporter substrate-binding protein [Thiofilum sp.]MBK8454594.1 transporter substrate-binding domain-containing protein [Thiofilum sp.]